VTKYKIWPIGHLRIPIERYPYEAARKRK